MIRQNLSSCVGIVRSLDAFAGARPRGRTLIRCTTGVCWQPARCTRRVSELPISDVPTSQTLSGELLMRSKPSGRICPMDHPAVFRQPGLPRFGKREVPPLHDSTPCPLTRHLCGPYPPVKVRSMVIFAVSRSLRASPKPIVAR